MPAIIELQDPTSNSLRDLLLGVRSGGMWGRNWNERRFWSRKKLVGCGICVLIILASAAVTAIVLTQSNSAIIIPTTVNPPTSTTTIKTTTTVSTPTSTKATTTAVTITTTSTPVTTASTATTSTPLTTTSTATTSTPLTTTSTVTTTTTPFHPTTSIPLPANANSTPPISLLYQMKMEPVFTQINCTFNEPPTFEFQVQVLGSSPNYTGLAGRKELAKTAAARAANEALFGLNYTVPIPVPKYPCH